MSEDIEVLAVKRIDEDRRGAHVRVGEITIGSLWIVGLTSGRPRTSWPETGKGYPIVVATPELKAQVDQLVLEHAGIATTRSPPQTPRRDRRQSTRAAPSAQTEPDFDDPLDDIFGGGSS